MDIQNQSEPAKDYVFKSDEHLCATSSFLDNRIQPSPPSFQKSFEPNDVYYLNLGRGRLIGQEFYCHSYEFKTNNKAMLYLTSQAAIEKKQSTNVVVSGEKGFKYISCSNAGFNNFYHWMFQALPAILQSIRTFKDQKFKLVVPPLNGFRRRTIEILELSDEYIHELQHNESLECDELFFCNLTSGDFSFRPSPYFNSLFDDFRSKAIQKANQSHSITKKVFISRKDSPKRGISNEEEVTSLLRQFGFMEVQMSKLSLEEQVTLFSEAEYIVAPHGAGLVHLIFGTPKLNVLELMPNNYINDCFYRICVLRGQHYFNLYSDSIGDNHYHYTDSKVNTQLLEEKLIMMNLKKEQ